MFPFRSYNYPPHTGVHLPDMHLHTLYIFRAYLRRIAPPNRRPLAISRFASILLLTVITIADPHLLLLSFCSLSRFSLISQRGVAFNGMLVEDSTSLFKSSIFPGPRYRSSDIPCTLRRCHCSRTSTPITTSSIVFAARINIFDC